jgi:hypothetical protein
MTDASGSIYGDSECYIPNNQVADCVLFIYLQPYLFFDISSRRSVADMFSSGSRKYAETLIEIMVLRSRTEATYVKVGV